MSYVLSVIHPPVAPAAHGKAVIMQEEVIEIQHAGDAAGDVLIRMDVPVMVARMFGNHLARIGTGVTETHQLSGFAFRVDPADNAPHPCPCCERLVLPEDHAYAGHDDALCTGCFSWGPPQIPQCHPANTAHTEEP